MLRVLTLAILAACTLNANPLAPALELIASDGQGAAASQGVVTDSQGRVQCLVDANLRYQEFLRGERVSPHYSLPVGFREALALRLPGCAIEETGGDSRLCLWLAPAQIPTLANLLRLELPNGGAVVVQKPVTTFGGVQSEGAARMAAGPFHNAGLRGAGVDVAIVDIGFADCASRCAGELGAYTVLPTGANLDCESEVHGTACAEIIRDVAPDARIHLMRLGTGLWIEEAAQAATDLGCQVVSMSLAWLGYPENGAECDAIRAAAARGIVWVNAAGNWQDRHTWESGNPVIDSNGWVEFAPGVRYNPVTGGAGVSLAFGFEAPNAGYARFETVLYQYTGGAFVEVSTGNSDFYLQHVWASGAANYYVSIRQVAPGTVGALRLQSFGNHFGYHTAEGSMSNPATVRQAVSVGAVGQGGYGPGAAPASYSSTGGGPLALKLDLCGPTGCTTLSYSGTFIGTSCAAPNIAGLLALHFGWAGAANAPVAAIRMLDVMATGMDPFTGQGLALCAQPDIACAVGITSPAPGSVIAWAADLPMSPVRFEGIGGSGIYTFSLCGGNLPTGLHLDAATGWLAGTSAASGTFDFTVRITDSHGLCSEADYSMVLSAAGALVITAPAKAGPVAANAGVQFEASGVSGTAHWDITAGMLPPGMVLSDSGSLTGTPRVGGVYGVTVRVTDSMGNQCSRVYELAASGASPLPTPAGGQGGCAAGANAGAPLLALLLLAVTWARKRKNFPRTATPARA